jgi:hypothetical protein
MEPKDEKIQDRLLSHLPNPSNAAGYRKEVALLLEKNDKSFLREKWGARALWIFCIVLGTSYIWFGSAKLDTPGGLVRNPGLFLADRRGRRIAEKLHQPQPCGTAERSQAVAIAGARIAGGAQ